MGLSEGGQRMEEQTAGGGGGEGKVGATVYIDRTTHSIH